MKEICYFFKFYVPQQWKLINSIKKHAPDYQKISLSDFWPIRWIEKVMVLDYFEELFAPILSCLEEMSFNIGRVCNQNTSAKANSFFKLMTSFHFLSSSVINRSIVDSILDLIYTQLFQGLSCSDAAHLIESLKRLICCKRNTINTSHKKCYSDIPAVPCMIVERSNMQKNHDNIA